VKGGDVKRQTITIGESRPGKRGKSYSNAFSEQGGQMDARLTKKLLKGARAKNEGQPQESSDRGEKVNHNNRGAREKKSNVQRFHHREAPHARRNHQGNITER